MSSLVRIDELLLDQHGSLRRDDECYYLFEYTANQMSAYSIGNRLIINAKKKMTERGKPGWHYKAKAIDEIGRILSVALPALIDFSQTTFVPIPPSKTKHHPEYDDRVCRMARLACPEGADIQELLYMKQDMVASHERQERATVAEIMKNLGFVAPVVLRDRIVLFDDMVTGGNHFRAAKEVLQEQFHCHTITGVFVARRVVVRGGGDDNPRV